MTEVKDLWNMINNEGKSTEDIVRYVMSEDNLSYRDATAKIRSLVLSSFDLPKEDKIC